MDSQGGENPFPDREELPLNHDTTSPSGAMDYCRNIARRTVMAAQVEAGTKAAAIDMVARRYRLGSFLRKLWHGERVCLHLDKVRRLELAYARSRRDLRENLGLGSGQ